MSLLAAAPTGVNIPKYTNVGVSETAPIAQWNSIGDIVSRVLQYVFPIAGILVFIYLLYGGINLMIANGSEEGIKEGRAKITNALVGFLVIFVAYWIVQILEIVLGVQLLNWNL